VSFADSNRVSLRYIVENPAAWGQTPASGVVRELRLTSSSLAASKETVTSDELRADRMVSSVVEVSATSGGDVNFEYSAGSQDDFIQQFVLGQWSRPMGFDQWKGATLSWVDSNTIRISGADYSTYFTVGRRIKTEGFANPNNNGYFEVSAVAFAGGNTNIDITGAAGTPVAEAGTAAARLFDANDVIVLNNATVEATASTNSFDGTGVFTSAIAAGQLKAGQKIHVNGLGYATGEILFDEVATTVSIEVDDGVNDPITYTFGGGAGELTPGADADDSAEALAAAILADVVAGNLNLKVSVATDTVTLVNMNDVNGSITEIADDDDNTTITDFTGASPTARGFFTVASANNDSVVVVEEIAADAAAGLPVTVKGSMLRNPGDVAAIQAQSTSIATSFNDVDKHLIQDGLRVGSWKMDVSSGAVVTGSFTFQGRETRRSLTDDAFLVGGSYVNLQAPATEVMNATTNVGSLTKNGVELATALQSIALEGDASLRNQMAVGSKFPRGIGTGRFQLTGTLTAYFENFAMYEAFIDHDTVSIGWSFTDLDGNTYFYTLPAIKITSDPVAPGGIDQDIMETMEFSAFRDQATACMIQIDRFSPTAFV